MSNTATQVTAEAIKKNGRNTITIQGCTIEISACFGGVYSVAVWGNGTYDRKRDLSRSRVVQVANELLAAALSA